MTMVLDRQQSLLLDDDYLVSDEGWWVVQLAKNHERQLVLWCGVGKFEAKEYTSISSGASEPTRPTTLNIISEYWMSKSISCRVLSLRKVHTVVISAKYEMFPPSPLILRLLDIT